FPQTRRHCPIGVLPYSTAQVSLDVRTRCSAVRGEMVAPVVTGAARRREASEGVAGRMEDRNEKGHYSGVCVAGRSNTGTGWAERGSNARLQTGRLGGAVHG